MEEKDRRTHSLTLTLAMGEVEWWERMVEEQRASLSATISGRDATAELRRGLNYIRDCLVDVREALENC